MKLNPINFARLFIVQFFILFFIHVILFRVNIIGVTVDLYNEYTWERDDFIDDQEAIERDNAYKEKCEEGIISCPETINTEPKPTTSIWVFRARFISDHPVIILLTILYGVIFLLLRGFYDVTFPKINSYNSKEEEFFQGRAYYEGDYLKKGNVMNWVLMFYHWLKLHNCEAPMLVTSSMGVMDLSEDDDPYIDFPGISLDNVDQLKIDDDGYLRTSRDVWKSVDIDIESLKEKYASSMDDLEKEIDRAVRASVEVQSLKHHRPDLMSGKDRARKNIARRSRKK